MFPKILVTIKPFILSSSSVKSNPPSKSMSIILVWSKVPCADGGNVNECVAQLIFLFSYFSIEEARHCIARDAFETTITSLSSSISNFFCNNFFQKFYVRSIICKLVSL